MAITRITVRTFQNEQHAELFLMFGKNLLEKSIQRMPGAKHCKTFPRINDETMAQA